jgi:YbbR domain-containing protein
MIGQPILLPIDLEYNSSLYTITSKEPDSITFNLDKLVTITHAVTVVTIGEPADGYQAMTPRYKDTIQVIGSKSLLDTLEYITTEINLKNVTEDVVITNAELRAYDINDKDITSELMFNAGGKDDPSTALAEIDVLVSVYPIKTIPVNARIAGQPLDGYYVSSVEVAPKEIEVIGPVQEMENFNVINLQPINVERADSDKTIDINLWDYLGDTNIGIKTGGVSNVSVTVHIEKESVRYVEMSINNISIIRDDMSKHVELPNEDIIIVPLRGPKETLDSINPNTLTAELDLSTLTPGVHDVTLHFNLPAGVIVYTPVTLRVVVSADATTTAVWPTDTVAEDLSYEEY